MNPDISPRFNTRHSHPGMAPNYLEPQENARVAAFVAEIKLLAPILGSLSTPDQIAEASHRLTTLRIPGTSATKLGAVNYYIDNHGHGRWTWLEIGLYCMIGQTSEFLLDGQKLASDPKVRADTNSDDHRALMELGGAVQTWSYLALEGALGHLLMHDDVHEVKQRNGSAAELFRAYLRAHGVREWDSTKMFGMGQNIHKVAYDFRRINKERGSPGPDPDRQASLGLESISSSSVQQQSLEIENPNSAHASLKHGLANSEQTGNSATKRLRPIDVVTLEPTSKSTAEEPTVDKSLANSEEDLYNATPPPRSSARDSTATPQLSATISTSNLNTEPQSSATQTQPSGLSETPSHISHTASEVPEDSFLVKLNRVAEAARKDVESTAQAFAIAKRESDQAAVDYDKTRAGAKDRFEEVQISCSHASISMNPTLIRNAVRACRDLGLSEGTMVLKLLEPAVAVEEAGIKMDEANSTLGKLESKLSRLEAIFNED
ncbi:hypothetical protein VTL71DRAFT_14884 [Oculimacula yallundae]|uniref:Uncharacterized protein n=1 Tax=Oculimacula yallundae TaxID=86028 RepID=A0ABR4CFT2_9HELO